MLHGAAAALRAVHVPSNGPSASVRSQYRPSWQLRSVKHGASAAPRAVHVQPSSSGRHAVVAGLLHEASEAVTASMSVVSAPPSGKQSASAARVPVKLEAKPSAVSAQAASVVSQVEARISSSSSAAFIAAR